MSAASVVSIESSTMDQALALISEMSFADKLTFNAKLASLLAKETKGAGAVAKAAKKEKKEKDPDAPKRVAGAGQKAWFAYIEHCINTMPERFTDAGLRKEKLAVVAAIRAEDKAGYDAFVAKYKEEHPSAAPADAESDAASTASAPKAKAKPGPKPKAAAPASEEKAAATSPSSEKPMSAAEKIAAIKAKKAAAAAASTAPAAEKKEKKEKKPKAKGSAAAAVATTESDGSLARITIEGVDYHRDTGMNGLWKVGDDDESFGAWVGYYQPGNKAEPIRYTESPSDE